MALITPKKVTFSVEVMDRMWKYVENQIDFLTEQSQMFRDSTLPEWNRLLKGIPASEKKSFPFEGASNLVVQLIATRVEQMLSRAMVMYSVDPLWSISATGDIIGAEAEEQARILEQFMADMAVDPEELNLYRKEEIMIHDGIAYGTSFMGFPWQYITEANYVGLPGGITTGVTRADEFAELVVKDGPSPENIPLDRILIDNATTELEKAKFVGRMLILTREMVEDRIAFGIWSKADGEKVLTSPDIVNGNSKLSNNDKNTQTSTNKYAAKYLVHECHIKFTHDKKIFSIMAHFHMATKTRLSAVFNYFPKNMLPLEDMRFGYDGDQYLGYGFIEMLKGYQEEVSTLHNNRLDNEAIRNNVSFRIDPDSELASVLKFYPGVALPAKEGELEVLDTKAGAVDNAQSESASISMTNERSGIDPAISGNGSGIVNSKRGIYSSQGTMAVLQQQNNRTGLRMMDIRTTHTKVGRKLLDMYANLGIGKRLARYGTQSENLRKALDSVRQGNLGLVLKASSAASNVESDRQNSILLQGIQEKYIGTVNQIMQALTQPQVDDNTKKFLIDTLFAEQSLTRDIFRVFGKFNVDTLIPFPESIKNARLQQQQATVKSSQSSQRIPQNSVPTSNSNSSNPVPTMPSGEQGGKVN